MPIVICPRCSVHCLVITEENSTRQHSCPGCGSSLADAPQSELRRFSEAARNARRKLPSQPSSAERD